MPLVGKSGVNDIYDIPDTELEKAKEKGYEEYIDVTKDDKDTFTIPKRELEKAKSKGYRLFGQSAIEQTPAAEVKPTPAPSPTPMQQPAPVEEGGAMDWIGRAAESAVETAKALPSGLYQLGKEVVTQPGEAALAAIRGTGVTFGLQKPAGVLAGAVEAGKALVTGEEVGPAYERARQAEEERALRVAEESKRASPAAYGAGPYVAAGVAGRGAGLLTTLGLETTTGAAQQLAEKGKIDTAELAGQTVAGTTALGVPAAAKTVLKPIVETIRPATAAEKAAKLERKAVAKAEETAAIGDIAEKYTGPGGSEKIRAAKRAPFEAEAAKTKYKQVKAELDNEFNARVNDVEQRNSKLESEYSSLRAQRAAEYNDLIKQFDAERQRVGGANEQTTADYQARLEAHNMETQRLQQQYNDAKQKFEIEKADLDQRKQQKAKQVDEEYLGKREEYVSELPQWQEKVQQQKAENARIAEENKLKTAEYRAQVQKTISDYKNTARDLRNQAVQKAKEARRTLKGEAVTAMGDELRGMLDNMEEIQNQAYQARKQVSAIDENFIDDVTESATAKAIDEAEQVLNTNYMLDENMRQDLLNIKMKVNPEYNTQKINRGKDFEALLEVRQYLDNVNNDLRLQARSIQRQGGSVPVELTTKRKALKDARQRIQTSLYGEQSPFSPELRSLGEAADNIYSDFRNAKGAMQQRGILSKEKAVPGMESGLEPRTNLIENYFDELDAGRKAETKQLLQEFGVDVKRLDLLEEQVKRGTVPEEIAIDQLKLPDRPVFVPPTPLAPKPIAPARPLPSDYMVEGATPIKPMKPVLPGRPAKPALQPLPSKPVFEAPPKPAFEILPGKRILTPEEMQSKGYIAQQEGLAQEFKALGGKTAFTPAGIPTTQRGMFERGLEYGAEKLGIGQTPMQMLERAAQIRMTPTMLERVRQVFPESPGLTTALIALKNQGRVITPAVVRAVARSQNISEEKLAEALVQGQTP